MSNLLMKIKSPRGSEERQVFSISSIADAKSKRIFIILQTLDMVEGVLLDYEQDDIILKNDEGLVLVPKKNFFGWFNK